MKDRGKECSDGEKPLGSTCEAYLAFCAWDWENLKTGLLTRVSITVSIRYEKSSCLACKGSLSDACEVVVSFSCSCLGCR